MGRGNGRWGETTEREREMMAPWAKQSKGAKVERQTEGKGNARRDGEGEEGNRERWREMRGTARDTER